MTLAQLNALSVEEARAALLNCCTASRWVEAMVARRPYGSPENLFAVADTVWADMSEADYLEAFAGHPKIGNIQSLKAKYAHTKHLASGEQSGVDVADDATLLGLAEGNRVYQDKFGFIFIVCASGKTAAQMLELLRARLPNTREQELGIAAAEQAKITRIRLEKLLAGAAATTSPSHPSPITTHVLDTARGLPAMGVPVKLLRHRNNAWAEIASGTTNADGRLADWLAGQEREAGHYRIDFDTQAYFDGLGERSFYPAVRIEFIIDQPEEHYHVPLLISPFGYSTYRGS